MNWKNFKSWLDQNVVESDGLLVKIKANKSNEYGELSVNTLTNFCDSLEATLDNNASYHLFPAFSDKGFQKLFDYHNCYFGKKTNQEKVNKTDYDLLEKMFDEWKLTQSNNINTNINTHTMTETRNIILIGRTGGGKSTLGNVLVNKNDNFEEVFKESDGSISATKDVKEAVTEIDISRDGSEKIKYRIIDTIGIGDTKLTTQGVLTKLAAMAGRVKEEGLNHILFVTQGRFTKEEIEAYDLLSSIVFDSEVLNYTTVIRTNFNRFKKEEACADDRAKLRMENADLAHILNKVNIIYVNNPPTLGLDEEEDADLIEINKKTRQESRRRLLTYLATCKEGNYRPSNIDTLDERVENYRTNEQLLKEKMKEIEKARKEQEEKFRQEIANLKEEQARELRENRIKFEDDIRKVKTEADDNLRKTKNDLEDTHRRDMADHDRRNEDKIQGLKSDYEQQTKNIKDEGERQRRNFEESQRRNDDKISDLQKKLDDKSSSSNTDALALIAKIDADNQAREERAEARREKREEQHRQDEANRQEIERKKAKMAAAWKKWEEDKKSFLEEQDSYFWGREKNWRDKMPKAPSGDYNDYK